MAELVPANEPAMTEWATGNAIGDSAIFLIFLYT
jgi:hypothetical protein